MNAPFAYYAERFPLRSPPPDFDHTLRSQLRCHFVSAREGLIDWADFRALATTDIKNAVAWQITKSVRRQRARRISTDLGSRDVARLRR